MKYTLGSLALAAAVNAHTIFQQISINGNVFGTLDGIRAPDNNNPVQDVNSPDLTCGQPGSSSQTLVDIPAGAQVGSYWWGNTQGVVGVDDPVALSHKGPVTYWLAKVDDAVNTPHTDLNWFKVAEDNLNTETATWGVDNVRAQNGWHYFTLPQCISDGQYLLRGELLALHSAGAIGEAQFYSSCAQIQVTGGGGFEAFETQKLPGDYHAEDPSIQIGIYDANGQPTNSGNPYAAPGMRPITC